jgi:hypothetical protein
MKQVSWGILSWMLLLLDSADAVINMQEREHVQTFVWILEAVAFVSILVIFLLVWHISRREIEKRKNKINNI